MTTNKYNDAWAKILAAVWTEKDGAMRRRLEEDPRQVFEELGASFPEEAKVNVIANTHQEFNFVIPMVPAGLAEISDEDIAELYQACPGTQLDMGN